MCHCSGWGLLLVEHEEEEVLAPTRTAPRPGSKTGAGGVRVLGTGGLHTTIARCCNPLPGDRILGDVTRARGVTVHRESCRTVKNVDEIERLVECDWGPTGNVYESNVELVAWD